MQLSAQISHRIFGMGLALALLGFAALPAQADMVQRSQPAAVPEAMPQAFRADPNGCWAQDRVGGEDRLFAVPCPHLLDRERISTLQRALAVRGLYSGAVNGEMDQPTRDAVRRLQAPMGLDSAILSLDAARHLGVVVWAAR